MVNSSIIETTQKRSKSLLYALVLVLVFEGILRKLAPGGVGTLIFVLKDILCFVGLFYVNRGLLKSGEMILFEKWKVTLIVFVPLILFTILLDPILSIFGLKQYLLFTVVAVLVPLAFPTKNIAEFKKFVLFVSALLIPTTLVAVIQNSLPATHWLNLSVDGESLEGFSADGFLRVSSTFSFTGQYSYFLNLATPFLMSIILWPKKSDGITKSTIYEKLLCGVAVVALIIGVFITGGRSAVLGCGLCILLGLVFSAIKSPGKIVVRGLVGFGVFVVIMGTVRAVKPEFFAAYEERSSEHNDTSQSEEMQSRVQDSFMNWTTWLFDQDIVAISFGNGLGVMSNGSEKISVYARDLKANTWGRENDLDTTLFEGGIYLAIIWSAFRLWAIFYCVKVWQSVKRKEWAIVVSFFLAYVILNATLGQLGKQPPLSIWLWLSVGVIALIKNYNNHLDKELLEIDQPGITADAT